MINFSDSIKKNKTYNGANGNKLSVIYNNEQYMLKFSSIVNKNKNLNYSNGVISEYIGSHIFELLEIPVQKTFLGMYIVNGKNKIIVACKDFTKPGIVFQDFASLKNTMIDSEKNGYGTDLDEILYTINSQNVINIEELISRFWDMFIIDALIGNMDRHNGNWGFLYDTLTDEVKLAPVFDCGSSLFPQADDSIMNKVINVPFEADLRIYEFPSSSITINKKKINYFEFISSNINKDCTASLMKIYPKIKLEVINEMIDSIECLNDLEKEFYKKIIRDRKEKILEYSYNKIINEK